MTSVRIRRIAQLLTIGVAGFATVAIAQTTVAAPSGTSSAGAAPALASNPTNKLVTEFAGFAGSKENASALINGLRTGSDITLKDMNTLSGTGTTSGTGTAAGTASSTTSATTIDTASTSFSPGTKPMGYGNIKIALSLARTQLASQGVTSPTAEQLQGALVGTSGPAGSSQGVLQMRASGMGWGQIADSMGVKLGEVMSGRTTFAMASTATGSTGETTTASGASRSGRATTAAGTASRGSGKTAATDASGTAAGNAYGKSGITNAAGGMAKGNPHVTTGLGGAGGAGSSSGVVNAAGGKANGNAAGVGKGKS